MKRLMVLVIVAVLGVGGAMLYGKFKSRATPEQAFKTEPVTRGDLVITVGATGTVEPEEVVDVGAQVMGRISELGEDPRAKSEKAFEGKRIDYGSPVVQGMVLAQIDRSLYQAQFNQAEAGLAQAKANVLQMESKAMQADAEWKRAQRLQSLTINSRSPTGSTTPASTLPIRGISDADFVLAQANAQGAKANVEAAKAAVLQQEASLEMAKTNLEYTTILSPVSGTIIDRRVNVGQTVVSSLNAPSLFLIARDLRRMQVWASVNEADIGRLAVGGPVSFRVDAFPRDEFHGEVAQIRLNASMTQNVVIYTVVISVDNSDLKLLPYLTADVKFLIEKRADALLIPNAALRFEPKPDQIEPGAAAAPVARAANEPSAEQAAQEAIAREEAAAKEAAKPAADKKNADKEQASTASPHAEERNGVVWVVGETGLLRPISLRIGLSDGTSTEVLGGELTDKMEVVVGERVAAASTDAINPLGPPRFRGGGKKPATAK